MNEYMLTPWGFVKQQCRQENADFVFKDGLAFPRAMACGNYRTPAESPYGYGPHIVKGPVKVIKGEDILADYDDRLRQFYPERWSAACKLLTGRFRNCGLKSLSAFLSHLYDKPVAALQVIEGCNVSNGYPYFIFISRDRARAVSPDGGDALKTKGMDDDFAN